MSRKTHWYIRVTYERSAVSTVYGTREDALQEIEEIAATLEDGDDTTIITERFFEEDIPEREDD
jgi:hypothetical protein